MWSGHLSLKGMIVPLTVLLFFLFLQTPRIFAAKLFFAKNEVTNKTYFSPNLACHFPILISKFMAELEPDSVGLPGHTSGQRWKFNYNIGAADYMACNFDLQIPTKNESNLFNLLAVSSHPY